MIAVHAKARYHSLKDYENEIVILDEGISYHGIKQASHLVTRRDSAIKALYKKQEAERAKAKKEEDRKKKLSEKKALTKTNENERTPSGKSMLQLDDDGTIIAEFSSVSEASKALSISPKSIRDAAKGVQKHAAGYCWKYKDDFIM